MNAVDSDSQDPKRDENSPDSSGSQPGSQPGSVGGQSVLVEIERLIGTKFRVRLRDISEDLGPDVAVGEVDLPIRDIGRYQTIGEIARGGVGVVIRCRDMDLGRDVAMKVIRDEHIGNQVTLQRFVEEAQVGGQLQHPGVVPVYELGLREDGRPYFTMKLIKGKTLAALLTDRKEPTDDLRKFLRIFEQICHTLAFAHTRGVVHRDLKPANILVGGFGEVMVSDWGFAKVLSGGGLADERRAVESQVSVIETVRTLGSGSESMAGSVMGTPAYMSPEQALGDVDRLDERSDVFSLGALLVEILTGVPPYTGRTAEEVLMKAARYELDMAEERLRESGADRRLVDLALLCLKKERKKRPRNAKILAKAITAYLSSVEKRLRNAQVVAAKALYQAQGERKARRLTTALAAAVLLVAAIGGGGFLWMHGKKIAAAEQHSRSVGQAFEDAGQLATEARRSGDVKRWADAEETAALAQSLAEDGEIDEERIRRIDDLCEAINAEANAARQIAERQKTNQELLCELEQIRTGGTDATGHAGLDAAYASAFGTAGIDVDALDTSELVAKVRENGLAAELAPVFDSWAVSRKQVSPDARGDWMKLLSVAREVDPNDWRNRFREAWSSGGEEQILGLASAAQSEELDAYSLSLLANALGQQGEIDRAIDVLKRAAEAHPGDFWLHAWLGYWQCREKHWKEAVREYTAALAIQPESAGTWNNLAWALGETGQGDKELAALERAIRINPVFARALYNEGIAYWEQGNLEAALSALEKAVHANKEYALAWRALGTVRMEMAEYRGAKEAISRAIDLRAGSKEERIETLKRMARVCLKQEDYYEAKDYLVTATAIDKEDAEALTLLGDAWWPIDRDEAEISWIAATQVDPDYDYARRKLVDAYEIRDSLPKHLDKWQADVDESPNDWQAWYNLGIGREMIEDWNGAIHAFAKAVDLHGESGWTHYAYANVLRHVHAYTEALEHFKIASNLITTDSGILNDLGATYWRLRRPDHALRSYRNALHRNPGDLLSLYNLGHTLISYGHTQSGLNELKKALQIDPTYFAALSRYVTTLCWRRRPGDVGEATRAAEEAVRWDKEDPDAPKMLGTALGYRKSLDVAKARQKKFLRDAAEPTLAAYWNNFGASRFRCGDAATAVAAWRIARDLDPEDSIAIRNLPLGLRALGDPEAALAECVDMVKRSPESKAAQQALAETLQARGDRDAAVEAWEEVFSQDSRIVAARNALVGALYQRGSDADYEKAVGIVLESARAMPEDPDTHSLLGQCLGWIGDSDRALGLHAEEFPEATVTTEATFRRGFAVGLFDRRRLTESLEFAVEAAEMQPGNPQHHWSVAWPICWQMPYAEAVEKYRELFPERSRAQEVQFFRALANCYVQQRNLEDALAANQEVRKRLPVRSQMLPSALYQASTILRLMHRHDEAVACVRKMARLIPGNFWPDRAMAEILMDVGRHRDAAHLLSSAVEAYQGVPLPRFWLGVLQLHLGDFETARETLVLGRLMTGYIERGAWWIGQTERMIELSTQRASILTGTAKAATAGDAADFARFCRYSGYPLQAVAWYDQAFEKDPALLEDLDEGHRFNAAQAALLAAAGKGAIAETLGADRRAAWRARALAWMKEELVAWRKKVDEDPRWFSAESWRGVYAQSGYPGGWAIEPEFAVVAVPELAAKLPPKEKAEWGAIFSGARDLVRRPLRLETK